MKNLLLLFTVVSSAYASCVCNGDLLIKDDDGSQLLNQEHEIYINGNYAVFGNKLNQNDRVFIYENGVISFGENFTNQILHKIPLRSPLLIAGFWTEISTSRNASSRVSYHELLQSDKSFEVAKSNVMCLLNKGFTSSMSSFNPTNIFVVTWKNLTYCESVNATFQVVLVIDSDSTDSETYALLLYEEVGENSCDTFVEIGFNEGNGDGSFTPFEDDYFNDIPYGTNVGKRGAYAYDISHFTILSANELTLKFINNSPSVSKNSVEANFTLGGGYTSLEGVLRVKCTIFNKETGYHNCTTEAELAATIYAGSNGTISTNLPASIKPYILRVTVYNGDTCVVTLKGKFRVYGDQEDYYCGVHFTNYGTQILNSNITFVSMGATRNFSVILDGDIIIRYPNTSLQLCREVLYGDHGECWKLYCELDWEHIIKPTVLKNSIKRHNLKVIPDSYNDTDHDRICEYEESLKRMKYTFY